MQIYPEQGVFRLRPQECAVLRVNRTIFETSELPRLVVRVEEELTDLDTYRESLEDVADMDNPSWQAQMNSTAARIRVAETLWLSALFSASERRQRDITPHLARVAVQALDDWRRGKHTTSSD
jgi:hypothetical protein